MLNEVIKLRQLVDVAVLDRFVIKLAIDRLYEAIEKGFLPLDLSLQERSHKLNARSQELLI